MNETYPCVECGTPMKPQTSISKFPLHRFCWLRFQIYSWWDEFLLSWSRFWDRIDGFVDNHLAVALGFLAGVVIWFAVMSQYLRRLQ